MGSELVGTLAGWAGEFKRHGECAPLTSQMPPFISQALGPTKPLSILSVVFRSSPLGRHSIFVLPWRVPDGRISRN